MGLKRIVGERRAADYSIVSLGIQNTPSVIIDCANAADIHSYRWAELDSLSKVKVVPAESLYRFKPTISSIREITGSARTKRVYITSFSKLFDYDDEKENKDVFITIWKMLEHISKELDITVAVEKGSIHEKLSANAEEVQMGHTITSQRMIAETIVRELGRFGNSLREDERSIYSELLKQPLKHLGSITNASSFHTWATVLLAIILEQQKQIRKLETGWQKDT